MVERVRDGRRRLKVRVVVAVVECGARTIFPMHLHVDKR